MSGNVFVITMRAFISIIAAPLGWLALLALADLA